MIEIFEFLRDLRANNNRDWFNANKNRYLAAKAEADALTERLIAGVATFDPSAASLRVSDCTYRIYRDTRFSADKTPYKTHIGIYINPPGGKKSPTAGYYLHIEPGQSLVAAGAWCPDTDQLRAIRQDIFDNVDEYLEIINDPEFARYYKEVGEDLLKTAPKGFPKDWPHIGLLRPRSFTAYAPLADRDMMSRGLEAKVMERMAAAFKFNRFLNFTLSGEN